MRIMEQVLMIAAITEQPLPQIRNIKTLFR